MGKKAYWVLVGMIMMLSMVLIIGCGEEEEEGTTQTDSEVLEEKTEEMDASIEEGELEEAPVEDESTEDSSVNAKPPEEVVVDFVEAANIVENDPELDVHSLAVYTDNMGTVSVLELGTYESVVANVIEHEIEGDEAEVRGTLLKESAEDTKENEYMFYLEFKETMDTDGPEWILVRIEQLTGSIM